MTNWTKLYLFVIGISKSPSQQDSVLTWDSIGNWLNNSYSEHTNLIVLNCTWVFYELAFTKLSIFVSIRIQEGHHHMTNLTHDRVQYYIKTIILWNHWIIWKQTRLYTLFFVWWLMSYCIVCLRIMVFKILSYHMSLRFSSVLWCSLYDFRIKTMFGPSLTPIYLQEVPCFIDVICVFCVYSGVQHV
jgi:hypothetical protein